MKKIILMAMCWPIFIYPLYAQKEKTKKDKKEIIIIKKGDKEQKLTVETKDGNVFINGKPSSEYKGEDVSVITQGFKNDNDFLYAPEGDFHLFNKISGEKKAFLGVVTEKAIDGVKITDVSKGSAAEKAGLKKNDIITKIENKNISTPDELVEVIATYKPGENITIYYTRDGKSENAKATLGARSISQSFSFKDNGLYDRNFKIPDMSAIPHPYIMQRFGRGRLGLRIEDTENNSGVKITNVYDESVAAKAGLKTNDIITEVNGKKIKDVNEIKKELADIKDKTSYTIKALRNGTEMNFEIKIPKKINKAEL